MVIAYGIARARLCVVGSLRVDGINMNRVVWNENSDSEGGDGMIERKDSYLTLRDYQDMDERSGRDRRKTYTMLNPDMDRRKADRRKKQHRHAVAWR
jgi:hypothetical protein